MKKLGSLWSKVDKNGNQYFTGTYGDRDSQVPIVVFSNRDKEGKQPDWVIYLSEPKKDSSVPF